MLLCSLLQSLRCWSAWVISIANFYYCNCIDKPTSVHGISACQDSNLFPAGIMTICGTSIFPGRMVGSWLIRSIPWTKASWSLGSPSSSKTAATGISCGSTASAEVVRLSNTAMATKTINPDMLLSLLLRVRIWSVVFANTYFFGLPALTRCSCTLVAVAQSVERPFKGTPKRCNSLMWVWIPAAELCSWVKNPSCTIYGRTWKWECSLGKIPKRMIKVKETLAQILLDNPGFLEL